MNSDGVEYLLSVSSAQYDKLIGIATIAEVYEKYAKHDTLERYHR